jgi:hypothetical protein
MWLGNSLALEEDIVNRFEIFTAAMAKNAVFWDIRSQFVPHRKHVASPLQSPAG